MAQYDRSPNGRVTKDLLIKHLPARLKFLGIDHKHVTLTSGSAMVMHGIADRANDIDMVTSPAYYEELKNSYPAFAKLSIVQDATGKVFTFATKRFMEKLVFELDGIEIEIWAETLKGQTSCPSEHEGFPRLATLPSIIYMKACMGRPQDLHDIIAISDGLR